MGFYNLFSSFTQDPLIRKKRYVKKVADPFSMRDIFARFNMELELIWDQIAFSFDFKWLLDLFLDLQLLLGVGNKCVFGQGKYGECLIDPEQVSGLNLKRFAWDTTYKTTHHREWKWKNMAKTLKDYIDNLKQRVEELGVAKHLIDAIEFAIAMAEGKVLGCAYWGFSSWNVARWMETHSESSRFEARSTMDWMSTEMLETMFIQENWWGKALWNYARWSGYTKDIFEEICKRKEKEQEEFRQRVDPLWQSVFFLQRTDRMHVEGGYHQVRLGHRKFIISRILDRYGVPPHMKKWYYNFAEEVMYLYKHEHRHYKQWKHMLNLDQVIEKWARMGLDRQLLKLIADTIISGVS